ncbi:MAG: ABC transporter ATP-binding protein [Alphaproteobacteria bacterium]|nr:ABC transporter ATP-binding protein [Alphaproteobacteria bacterium]MBV8548336.1 ABC transporter ATP-binding protein [Alphaproteobacteria bacterium]
MQDAGVTSAHMPEGYAIAVHDLHKSFGQRHVVRGCSINVPYGNIYGFLGPNGTGKTTTIRMLCGLLTPDAGTGTCLGYNIRTQSALIKRQAGYMPQKFGLYDDLTIRENLEFVARLYEMPDAKQVATDALHRLGLHHRQNQLAGQLSGGWKQRLALAACVLHKPRLLLLDEPTAGVDPKARREFWDEIHAFAAEGITVLVSTHYMDEAERCHQIGYLLDGKLLVHGAVSDIIAQSRLSTWRITAQNTAEVMHDLQKRAGVEMATSFGTQLHIAGADAEALQRAIESMQAVFPAAQAEKITPSLEDIFIHTMAAVGDRDSQIEEKAGEDASA